jgi:hypothetical protein
MGLFVVGRLAARHGVRVRLRQVPRGGLSALIWLPGPIATFESAPPLAGLRRRPESRGFHPFFRPGRRSAAVPAGPAALDQAPLPAQSGLASLQDEPAPLIEPIRITPSGLPMRPAQPAASEIIPASARSGMMAEPGDAASAVEVPGTPGSRLPIYDSVESDWFRHSGKQILPRQPAVGLWTSPADEGFRAAQAAASPTTGAATAAGLPKRVPSANLIPGSIGGSSRGSRDGQEAAQLAGVSSAGGSPASQVAAPASPPPPAVPRRPEHVRSRLADLQRGARRGRTDAPWNFGADES